MSIGLHVPQLPKGNAILSVLFLFDRELRSFGLVVLSVTLYLASREQIPWIIFKLLIARIESKASISFLRELERRSLFK